MALDRPTTTLFLIESLDGKISTGDTDEMDVDKDFESISGVKEGLYQYYEIEKHTDIVSFNTGMVQAKIGVNKKDLSKVKKTPISFVIVDSKPHLDSIGAEYFAIRSKVFYLITNNKQHAAFKLQEKYPNIEILYYEGEIDFTDVFKRFKRDYGINRVTIQTGGTLNASLLRAKLIDRVSIVVAPCLIGGKNTPALISGESLHTEKELSKIKPLELISCQKLKYNYLHLIYKVVNDTEIAQ